MFRSLCVEKLSVAQVCEGSQQDFVLFVWYSDSKEICEMSTCDSN